MCGNGLNILQTALLCWKWIKNLTIGLNMWEVFEKRLKYVGNDVDMWEMDKNMCGKGLSI